MTAADFRRLALSLPGTEEHAHMDHPDFRIGGKIFATLAYPNKGYGMVKLLPDQQAAFVAADPQMFTPVKGAWGKQGATSVCLKAASPNRVSEALALAWERNAPNATEKAKSAAAPHRKPAKKRTAKAAARKSD